ncbi:MAG: hypothetical protein ACIALR_01970, partial [Blastopirellula sp. JB062]
HRSMEKGVVALKRKLPAHVCSSPPHTQASCELARSFGRIDEKDPCEENLENDGIYNLWVENV